MKVVRAMLAALLAQVAMQVLRHCGAFGADSESQGAVLGWAAPLLDLACLRAIEWIRRRRRRRDEGES